MVTARTDDVVKRYNTRMVEAAKRYASYDRSDPFCLDRCAAHIRQGLCKAVEDTEGLPWHWTENGRGQRTQIKGSAGAPGHYDALVISRAVDGEIVRDHKNMVRP